MEKLASIIRAGVSWMIESGEGVVKASPVCKCVGPSVGLHEVLPMDRCGDDRYDRLDVVLDRVLPLLIKGRTFVSALMVFVKLVGFGGMMYRGLYPRLVK